MTRRKAPVPVPVAVALALLLVSAGCLGASGGPTDVMATDESATTVATTATATTGSDRTATTGLDCPDDYDHYRGLAIEYVAEQTGSDPANVSVANDAFVDYPILGECYYHAKVRDAQAGRTLGVFLAENGTVADRDIVEARADAAYEKKYGNLSRDLYDRMQSANAGEQISVEVSVADVNQTAAKQAVDGENLSGAAYKEALSEEYQRRAENRTQAVVAELRKIEGVTVESVGTLRVQIRATPEAIEEIQRLDRVTWLDLRRETTTYLPGTTETSEG